jgi:hypothetical protein
MVEANFDMLTLQQQQHLQQQLRISQMRHQMMNNQMQQQVQQQPQQMHMDQLRQQQQFVQSMKMQQQQPQTASEMQMLQNKLAVIYLTGDFDAHPIADQSLSLVIHNLTRQEPKMRGRMVICWTIPFTLETLVGGALVHLEWK